MRPLLNRILRRDMGELAAVTTVAPGIAAEYRENFGIDCDLVLNAGPYRAPRPSQVKQPIRLVHHGGAQSDRQLERMIHGVGNVEGFSLDMYLLKMPREPQYFDQLVREANSYNNVRVHPAVAFDRVPETLDEYDLGLYLLPPNSFNNLHALPNKFFDFVQSGLPMVIGPSPEMAALAEEYGLGLVLPDWEAETLRNALPGITTEQVEEWQVHVCDAAKELSSESGAEAIRDVVAKALENSSG